MWNKIADVGMPRPGDYSVLAYHVNGSVEMVHCDDLNWSVGLRLYTHWMELPSPPTAAECGAEPVQPTTAAATPLPDEDEDREDDLGDASWVHDPDMGARG